MLFREPPPKVRKTNSRKGGATVQGAKRTRRKVAEIAEDPIEDDVDEDAEYPPRVGFPDDVDGTARVARPAARSAAPVRPTRTYTEVEDEDEDEDVVIIDQPQSASQQPQRRPRQPPSRDMVIEQCYRELLQLRDEVGLFGIPSAVFVG